MTEERQGFLGRWSRLKQARGADESPAAGGVDPGTIPEFASPEARVVPARGEGAEGDAAAGQAGAPPDLPPIESLDKDSDFTAFLREGVPEETKRLALRALWRSDPVLANLDGLLEYGEDFSAPWKTTGAVATVYRVGKGMPDLLEQLVEQVAEEVRHGDASTHDGEPAPQDALCSREEDRALEDLTEPAAPVESASRQATRETSSKS